MSELKLPSQMIVNFEGEESIIVYMLGHNPQEDGSIAYGAKGEAFTILINPNHKPVWP